MSTPRWLSEIVQRFTFDGDVEFADLPGQEDDGNGNDNGWTPDVPSVLEERPPRVPIIPDPPRPQEYRDQRYWDELTAALADEAVAWLRHADDLFRWREDLDRAKKRRQKQVARLRKQVAATPLPSQVVTS